MHKDIHVIYLSTYMYVLCMTVFSLEQGAIYWGRVRAYICIHVILVGQVAGANV